MAESYILRTDNLKKTFGGRVVLNNVNLALEKGKIYGLIGKNGAGKTTLMRIICRLSFPNEGRIELFGKKENRAYTKELKKIGVLIEYPSLYGKMTAKENLRLNKIIRGIKDGESEEDLLKLVGLDNVGKKRVKDFSLGMRQRLGIAIALQSHPELLILDEPVNGLDPVGVIEIRKLIKDLNTKRGITILISSHNLPELYQTATDYIILDKGSVKKIISQDELEKKCRHYLEIECEDAKKLAEAVVGQLEKFSPSGKNPKNGKERRAEAVSDTMVYVYDCEGEEKAEVIDFLYKNGFKIKNLSINEETLESYFINVVEGEE